MQKLTTRGQVAPDKVQVQWRMSKRVLNALRADADRQGFSTIPLYLNHLLSLHYFGKRQLEWKGEWVDMKADKVQVNWRMYKRVINSLQADVDKYDCLSIPDLLNKMLMFHYTQGNQ